jgi:hypothetical protein
MIGEITTSAIMGALAAVATYYIMAAIGLPVHPMWVATCASALFLVEMYHA